VIHFLHGEREVTVERLAADTTVLSYLRERAGSVGTKEGCASGDCGACTVVVACPEDDGLRYAPVNACIATLGSLHGKQLITVENLGDGSTWHPVQRAMVAHHGSQCGFCTPGFVMSLFALYHEYPRLEGPGTPPRERVLEALGGNLCRCTGYRPIIAAAQAAVGAAPSDHFAYRERATLDTLRAICAGAGSGPALRADDGAYHRPGSVEEVTRLLAERPHARLLAGGTDLMLERTQQLQALPELIDLCAVPELNRVEVDDQVIAIGAAVTHRGAQVPVLADYPELAELIERFGSLQIRTQGTLVGNIANASPIGDWPPVLLALGARLRLRSASGSRDLPIDEFFLDYRKTALAAGEFIERVEIPRRSAGLLLRAYKISKRYEDDISSVCAVFALDGCTPVRSARIACGGMAAIPRRAPHCEAALAGRSLDNAAVEDAVRALAEDFQPISDARASAEYRLRVTQNLLRRLRYDLEGDVPTRCHPVHQAEAARG
jgi:xanthine dehydrogenase small subunit